VQQRWYKGQLQLRDGFAVVVPGYISPPNNNNRQAPKAAWRNSKFRELHLLARFPKTLKKRTRLTPHMAVLCCRCLLPCVLSNFHCFPSFGGRGARRPRAARYVARSTTRAHTALSLLFAIFYLYLLHVATYSPLATPSASAVYSAAGTASQVLPLPLPLGPSSLATAVRMSPACCSDRMSASPRRATARRASGRGK
jgi:hypothetical protein